MDTLTLPGQRLAELEQAVAELTAKVQGYEQMFTAAAASPMAGQVMRMLGLRPPGGGG